ncbi:DUF4376 domain-containing protein [Bosea sp. BK604]|uniref:DUF4376 domain-containing protein n=1 Tax=Bosea sp. BK604 TaxID=2512180 RepID=UPI0010F0BE17|nr:DUF4376 domain-containing protein [Bosea sp. BK604]TCR60928.1 uncharacterized protein DUF4376 [Bosea sp. BK604]
MFAMIDESGRVCELFQDNPGVWPAPQRLVDVSGVEGIAENWTMDEAGAFHPPPASPPIDLLAYAADRRWRQEVGGITISGVPIATDDRSKIMIMGARVAAEADPDWSTIWHGADGGTYPIDAAAIVAISDAVQAHVNQGFATFAEVKAEIEAGEITTPEEVDAAFD